jgi:hypothetical protein
MITYGFKYKLWSGCCPDKINKENVSVYLDQSAVEI